MKGKSSSDEPQTIEQVLRSLVPVIEKRRKKSYLMLVVLSVTIVVAITGGMIAFMGSTANATVAAVSGCLVPVILLYFFLNGKYMETSRTEMIKRITGGMGYAYHEKGSIPLKDVQRHLIVPGHDGREIESGLRGSYNGMDFEIQDISLSGLHIKSGKSSQLLPGKTLRGIMVRLRLNRSLAGHIAVIPHAIMSSLYAAAFNGYQTVKPSNIKFEKIYNVSTSDTVEAKVVMTAGFCDQLMDSAKLMKAGWMMMSMAGGEVLMIFSCKGLSLEPTPLWRPVNSEGMLALARPFEAVYKLVDAIKSNHQIG